MKLDVDLVDPKDGRIYRYLGDKIDCKAIRNDKGDVFFAALEWFNTLEVSEKTK